MPAPGSHTRSCILNRILTLPNPAEMGRGRLPKNKNMQLSGGLGCCPGGKCQPFHQSTFISQHPVLWQYLGMTTEHLLLAYLWCCLPPCILQTSVSLSPVVWSVAFEFLPLKNYFLQLFEARYPANHISQLEFVSLAIFVLKNLFFFFNLKGVFAERRERDSVRTALCWFSL